MSAKKIERASGQHAAYGIESLSVRSASSTRWIFIGHSRLWRPPTDMYETEEAFVIQVEVAGMRGADFAISVQDRRVIISGVRQDSAGARAYHQLEIQHGEFRTEIDLPGPFDRDHLEADYNDGYLRLTLQKAKPRRIDVT